MYYLHCFVRLVLLIAFYLSSFNLSNLSYHGLTSFFNFLAIYVLPTYVIIVLCVFTFTRIVDPHVCFKAEGVG